MDTTTDGCSGHLSAAWRFLFRSPPPFEGCCEEHDHFYRNGLGRRKGDIRLLICTAEKDSPWWGIFMFVLCRPFGWLYYKPRIEWPWQTVTR